MNIIKCEQGSVEWLTLKLGVASASNISKMIAKKGTDARSSYMAELVAQVCTGEMPELNAKALAWGKEHEASARAAYEFETELKVDTVGFIYSDDKRLGCSPDGIVRSINRGVEIKCPFTSKVYIEFLTAGKIKKEYIDQCQFSMWVTGMKSWDFVNYDPRMKKNMLHIVTIQRDEAMMERFNTEIPEFLNDMDSMLDIAGFSFGDQWLAIAREA